ncbi:hypothetical protein SAMN04488523_108199 [Sulfitobacter brevis]|uniref:Uncharacterized protein n=1 Tax=Sulfitobacter brevis TaxID=74348 RepID=A0A1I2BST6_9RHOB|nr:hypothetical protein [Sulfitobacter brevis]SFE59142.1 hypothetical protein SAMN04488523_108199 [Sulfitobacter brevis]
MTSRSEKIAENEKKKMEEAQQDVQDILEANVEINYLIKSGFLDHGPIWTTMWFELDLKWFDGESSFVTIPEGELDEFIERATASSEAFELAKFVAALRIENGIIIPARLSDLMARYLKGDFIPARERRGRKVDTWGRDFIIARTMQILRNRWEHRRPNKRKGSNSSRKSISQIVHEALLDTAIGNVDVERIQKIYGAARKTKNYEELLTMIVRWDYDDEPGFIRV